MLRFITTAALITGLACPLWAQGVTSNGLFGSRTLGGSISGGTRNAFGSGGAGGLGGFGGGYGGALGGGGNQMGNAGQITGSERFIRDNRSANQFVGADTVDTGGFVGSLSNSTGQIGGRGGGIAGRGGLGGGLGGGMGGGMGSSFGMGGSSFGVGGRGNSGGRFGAGNQQMNGRNQNNYNSNRQINVRTTLAVGFQYQAPQSAMVQSRLSERLNEVRLGRLSPLQVELEDRVVTLRGRVATQDDRELAVRFARMEPGVETVVDQLTIDPSASETGSPSDR